MEEKHQPEQAPELVKESRRQVIKNLGIGAALLGAGALLHSGQVRAEGSSPAATAQPAGPKARVPALPDSNWQNNVLRMQRELQQALKKKPEERRWVMVIDRQKCVGCLSCTVACKAENALPPGVVYRPVLEEEVGQYPNVARVFTPRPCMHCDNPPCVQVCPVGATYKRPDGIVAIDYDQCIGCRYCLAACPYDARSFDFGDYYTKGTPELQPYELVPNHEYGKHWSRSDGSPVGNARKCTFCIHRVEEGILPACVTTCIGGATYFGDASLEGGLVRELISSGKTFRLKEELGAAPRVYYLS
ncbi:MAG: 4Fe-4S dicluster domain-containing protein [Firmicutes bacterium]|nr:4Fe-4S dicluster domain-containing protein [Bacillota bacterium]